MRWMAAVGFSVFALPVVLYFCLRGYAVIQRGYSWEQMDWNGDGTTTIGEFFETTEIQSWEVEQDGKKCVQYFEIKDTTTIRTDCP